MLFSTLAFVVSSFAFLAECAPLDESAGLVVLKEVTSKDGVSKITVYGDAAKSHSEVPARGLDLLPRCGSNQLVCDDQHLADRNACTSLVNDLRDSLERVPDSPRAMCGRYNNALCCVTWRTPVQNAVFDNLVDAAQKVLDGCRGDTGVSGETNDTLIGSTCTTQCLSSEMSGC
ncbi:hypothetical protein F5X98DRAFT_380739 [Xylaria grammica]|nr:hypothetical protein F5X98DRAFT_380739 [Xylaria grammica]